MQIDDAKAFVDYMSEGQPIHPANILEIVAINQGKSPLTMGEPTAPALGTEEFAELMAEGHLVIDTRAPAAFGSGHIPSAYNFNLASSEFEQRVGWVAPLDAPLLLVLDSRASVAKALHKLAFIGLDQRVKGYLSGGMNAWIGAGKNHQTLRQISVHELNHHLSNGHDMRALDVREPGEWDEGHIEGASSMSFKLLDQRLDEIGISPEEHVSVICAAGIRSSTACSILLRRGFENVNNVTGGMTAWNAADLPKVTD
jgi:hydroxyacylglutathione hydrolase